MKSTSSIFAAGTVLFLLAGCSDPANKVYKSESSAPQKPGSSTAAAGKQYVIRSESTVGFVASKVTRSHTGGFKKFSGSIQAAGDKIVGSPQVKIDMKSAWADDERLTRHLLSKDFFGVDEFPDATFTTTSLTGSGANYQVTGNLNLHGVTKSITFPATISVAGDAVTVKAEFAINRRDFNINYPGMPNDLIRDNVVLKLDIRATPGPVRPQDQI